MKLEKILEALEQTDQLCDLWFVDPDANVEVATRCTMGQLFYVAGKSNEEIEREEKLYLSLDMFDHLLEREYGITTPHDLERLYSINDSGGKYTESPKARHIRVTTYWKEELIECLISESQSSYHQEDDSNHSEDVSTVPLHMPVEVLI